MSEARLSVTLPEYETELAANQRKALQWGALLGAPLLVGFTFLDRATAPALWLPLLGIRVTAGCALGAVGILAQRIANPIPLTALSVALICATVEAAVLATGGPQSPYLISQMLVMAGVGLLMPLTTSQSLTLQALGLVIALAPLVSRFEPGDGLALVRSASYLATVAVAVVAGAHLQDSVRRREHRARLEVARQMGLITLGTLAGGLAHELSTPLTWVSVELEALEVDPLAAPVREKIRAARAGTVRMREVLIAMRQGARLGSKELHDVVLSSEMDLALTLVAQRIRSSGVTVVREYAPDVPLVSCQPTLLGQVLVNLVVNALDAMGTAKDARLVLRVRKGNDRVLVEVEDTGPGIPEMLRARIFQPFFSTKGEKGNGLGLWISSEIARIHGGELTVHAGATGALFRLSLPAEVPASRALPSA